MTVVPFCSRAEFETKAKPAYGEVSQSVKKHAISAVAELFFAVNLARTQSPEALRMFDRCAQNSSFDADGTFRITLGRDLKSGFEPIVQFYTSPQDGWICIYERNILRDKDIAMLVARAHQLISAEPGLALTPTLCTKKALAIG